ncbi:(d)CMP kinase [Microbacteriaceae bacterium VKM Ac-2854]|nr:(d)CMP kinase [Microbacteriaceae bacterium VKM Ac-2854]
MRGGRVRIVLIDGPSGSGKSTFATALARELGRAATLVRMDELYPGWGGLASGSAQTERHLVGPIRTGRPGCYRRWNWAASTPADWRRVDASRILILEGCGAATAANRRAAGLSIWVEADDDVRRARALARDGGLFDAHWEDWDDQFREHVRRNDPRGAADVILTN